MRKLILSHHGLGDNVLLTTSLKKLWEKDGHTFVLATLKRFGSTTQELLSDLPYIEAVVPILPDAWNDFNSYKKGLETIESVAEELRVKLKCDEVIFPKCYIYSDIENHKVFRFAHELGVTFDSLYDFRPGLKVKKTSIDKIKKQFGNSKFVVVHTKSGNPKKDLDKETLNTLVNDYNDYTLVEIGEKKLENSILFPEDSIEDTKALVYLANHVVAIDSVIMHIASAFDVPLTAIFTTTSISQTVPLHYNVKILSADNEFTNIKMSQLHLRNIKERYKNSALNDIEPHDARFKGFYYSARGSDFYKRWKFIEDKLIRLGKTKNLKVLDIGANNGYFVDKFSKIASKVIAVDIDEKQVNQIKSLNLPNVETRLIDNLLDFLQTCNDDFDVVLYMGVHHHIYEQQNPDYADAVINEISRISKCMFFEMGQVEETGSRWTIWKDLIPKMKDSRLEVPPMVLDNSRYKYCELISSTRIHDAFRWLFYFSDLPEPLKEIEFNNKKYKVRFYIYGKDSKMPGAELVIKETPLEEFDSKIRMQTRYYLVEDEDQKLFLVKEKLFPLGGKDLLPKDAALNEYERGQLVYQNKDLRNKVVPAIAINNNFLLFEYFNWPDLRILLKNKVGLNKKIADSIKKDAKAIFYTLGEYDFNINNILLNKDGSYKFIDFEYSAQNLEERINYFDFCAKQERNNSKILLPDFYYPY